MSFVLCFYASTNSFVSFTTFCISSKCLFISTIFCCNSKIFFSITSMILLSSNGFYFVANKLQPNHVDPLFPFKTIQFISSSFYSPPTIGYTSFVVGFPNLELSLLLPKINMQRLPILFPLLTLP